MEQLNPGQIKKNIKQLKQRQEQYLYYLGQLAFQAGEEGKLQEAGMLEAYQVLKDIQVQMVQGEASLEQIRVAKEAAQNPRCPQCGGSLPRGAAFCASCGANLAASAPLAAAPYAAAPAAPVPAGKACANCGAPLDDDAVFCGNCGASSAGVTVAAPAPTPVPAPAPPAQPVSETPSPTAEAAPPAQEAAVPAAAPDAAPSLEDTLACPKCGAGITEKDVIFCAVCGTKVRE